MSDVPIPEDISKVAETLVRQDSCSSSTCTFMHGCGCFAAIADALMAERERWKPAVTYFERYCQDEAESVEDCVCGGQQHEDAKAFRDAIRRGTP